MSGRRLRVGARPSRLSQAQTSMVVELIKNSSEGLEIETVPVKTSGDRLPPEARGSTGGKGAFTLDIEKLLLKKEIDVAVHSMKDLPSTLTAGLEIGATPQRSDPRDALLSKDGRTLDALGRGARVGTGSLRRKAQLMKMRPDLDVVDIRGNVDTRIRKIASGFDAIVLAAAGLERIGESGRISQLFSIEEMVPAVGQGVIAVEMRRGDASVAKILSKIDDRAARIESSCERAFIERLGGDCYVPIGGCARVSGDSVTMVGLIASEDGRRVVRRSTSSPSSDAIRLGRLVAESLLDAGGEKILAGAAS